MALAQRRLRRGRSRKHRPTDQPELTLNLRFPGQYHDEESGLYYNYFRTYDPNKGRYTQSDPIGLAGGIGTYNYAHSSPIHFMDHMGLCSEKSEHSNVIEYIETGWRLGFDNNGTQQSRSVTYSEQWHSIPIPDLLGNIENARRKIFLPIDVQILIRTTGEEVQLLEYERTVKAIASYQTGKSYSYKVEPIQIGPWAPTGKEDWVKTDQIQHQVPVGIRICNISCSLED